jgi:hypothetical protein
MRQITDHWDGHRLAESLVIEADPIDPALGGASHHYVVSLEGAQLARIQFWHGSRHEPGSLPGILDTVLLAIVIDRMRCFERGPLACPTNREVLDYCDAALRALKSRADDRARRGVLGKAAP